jgi:hypothetical protein
LEFDELHILKEEGRKKEKEVFHVSIEIPTFGC